MIRKIFKRAHTVPSTHTTQFIKKYGLSLFITIFFSAFIFQMLFLHAVPSLPVANVLTGLTNIGANNDPLPTTNTNFKTTDNTTIVPSSSSNASSNSEFAKDNGQSNGVIGLRSGPVFGASISSIHHDNTKPKCHSDKQKHSDCSKQYTFTATVATTDGPGTIAYGWRSTLPQAVESGVQTTHGQADTKTLTKTITLACDSPIRFTMQLIITAPVSVHSEILTINHNCDELGH